MTQEELLARITIGIEGGSYVRELTALRSVVELHNQVSSYIYDEAVCSHCSSVEDRSEILYPCPTIKVIESELTKILPTSL